MDGVIITDDIFTSDLMNDAFPMRFYLGELLKSAQTPLWIPHVYGGFPLLARSEAGVAYPINLLLFGLLPPYTALNLVILLTLIIAGVAMYFYLREIDAGYIGSVVGGIAFGLSGYLLSHLKHLSNVNAACWFPLGVFFIERAIRRKSPRYLLGVGLVFGLQNLAGHAQVAYYSGVFYVLYFVFRFIHEGLPLRVAGARAVAQTAETKPNTARTLRRLFTSRPSIMFVVSMILGSVLASVQLLPTYELVSLSQRAGGVTFAYASNYAYDPNNLLMFFYPYVNGDIGAGTYTGQSIFWEDYGYVGVTTLALAFFGAVSLRRNWHVRFHVVAFATAIVFVLGPATPLYGLVFHTIPGMSYFRFPTRFLLIADFSLIVLGVLGLKRLSEKLAADRAKKVGAEERLSIFDFVRRSKAAKIELAVLALVVGDLWYFQIRQNPIVDLKAWADPPSTATALSADTSLFRIYVVGGNESHKLAFARARGWEGDLRPYIDQRLFLQPCTNVQYGFSTPDGYQNFTPNYVVDLWGDHSRGGAIFSTATVKADSFVPGQSFFKIMNLANVKYLLSLWPVAHRGMLKQVRNHGPVEVYENPHLLSRAYLVNSVRRARDVGDAQRIMLSEGFNPSKEVVLMEPTPPLGGHEFSAGGATIVTYEPNSVVVAAKTEEEAILVLADTYYPGWNAYVDDRETHIYQANLVYRAVVVPPGDHTIRFRFEPDSARDGLYLSAFGIIAFLALAMVPGLTGKKIYQ